METERRPRSGFIGPSGIEDGAAPGPLLKRSKTDEVGFPWAANCRKTALRKSPSVASFPSTAEPHSATVYISIEIFLEALRKDGIAIPQSGKQCQAGVKLCVAR
jgi:hypothetical protein